MKIPATTSRIIEKIYAHLFSLFFVAQILSPSFGGKTIYLEYVVAMCNPFFWGWLKTKRCSERTLLALLCILGMAITGHLTTMLKILVNIAGMLYLTYLCQRCLWKLNTYLFISIFFAVAQLVLMGIDPIASRAIGPEAIAQMVWGAYATPTNTNFYAIFEWGIPRVAGLSREAGFLASFVVASFWLYFLRSKYHIDNVQKKKTIIYILGYISSFSKMSFAIVGVWLVHQFRRWVDKIPSVVVLCGWLVFFVGYWYAHQGLLLAPEGLTWLSRFGAYASILDLDILDFLFGIENLDKIGTITALTEYYGEGKFGGLGGWLITNGIFVFLLWFVALKFWGVTSTGFLMILMLTINVEPDTNQNFVVLAYYIVFQYYRINDYYGGKTPAFRIDGNRQSVGKDTDRNLFTA